MFVNSDSIMYFIAPVIAVFKLETVLAEDLSLIENITK